MLNLKKFVSILLSLIFVFCLLSCKTTPFDGELADINVKDGYKRIDILESNGKKTIGFGAQIDTDVFMPWNNLTPGEELMIENRIKDMNLQYTRIKMFPEFFERGNDNNDANVFDFSSADVDFNSEEMKALYKVLDICQKYNVRVDLSWYDCWTTFISYDGRYNGSWLGYDFDLVHSWASAPKTVDENGNLFNGYEEYAENVAVGLDYLINTKGYTCIYGYSFIGEMFVNGQGVIKWDEFVDCTKVINARVKKDGLLQKVKLIGTSNESRVKGYEEFMKPLANDFDVFAMGNYNWDNESVIEGVDSYFEKIMAISNKYNKEMIISECGTKNFIDATTRKDIDDYDAGLYMSRFMISCVSQGVTGINYYILGDTFFTNAYIHRLGLWLYRTEEWKAHPTYYFWALICKYTNIGSEIYPIKTNNEDVTMIAFRLPDGKWSYMIANNSSTIQKVAVVNPKQNRPNSLNIYKVTESTLPTNRECVVPTFTGEVDTAKGVAHLNLPAKSFIVASNK